MESHLEITWKSVEDQPSELPLFCFTVVLGLKRGVLWLKGKVATDLAPRAEATD